MDAMFTYRTPEVGATSKASLIRLNPIIKDIIPLNSGRIFSPLKHYSQSLDKMDEIIEEIAALLHPERFPKKELKYFRQLPDTEPIQEIAAQ